MERNYKYPEDYFIITKIIYWKGSLIIKKILIDISKIFNIRIILYA